MPEMESVSMQAMLDRIVDQVRIKNGSEPVRYDLGCGLNPAVGFFGVDAYAPGAIAADLFTDGGWSFADDSSVDVFYSSHFVEHVPDWNAFFERAYRKLKDGGYFVITTPYYLSVRATQDPDHKQMVSRERYYYLMAPWREANGLSHYSAKVDFEIVAFHVVWGEKYLHLATAMQTNPEVAENALRHIPNAVDDLTVVLRASKEVS